MKRSNFPGRKERRRQEAQERQEKRDERGDYGQLLKLTLAGHAAVRERSRLKVSEG